MSDAIIEIQPHEQVLLIAVLKRALDDAATRRLTNDILSAAAQTPRLPIVLDMSRVKFAPSVALGALAQMTKSFKLDGRRLALIGVDSNVLGSIRVTNLDALLEIYTTLEQVITPPAKGR